MGVSYDKAQGDKSRFQQSQEGAGATFKSVKKAHGLVTKGNVVTKKTQVEVKQDQREEFWSEQRKADEARRQVCLFVCLFVSLKKKNEKAAANNVPEARAEQTKLVKQREKYWKDNQAKGIKVKKAVENPDYQVSEEQRQKFWNEQQAQKGATKKASEGADYRVSEEERIKFWAKQEADKKGGAKRIGDGKDYMVRLFVYGE
jgi:hypothetical protein